MTACPAFEDRLIDYGELAPHEQLAVDEHLPGCAGCRKYLDTLGDLETALTASGRDVRLGQHTIVQIRAQAAVEMPVATPSKWPEWLDFVAATAVLALMAGLAWTTGLLTLTASG